MSDADRGWTPDDLAHHLASTLSRSTDWLDLADAVVEFTDDRLADHDAKVIRRTLRALAEAIERETANVDSVSTRHLIGRLYAAAETTPEGGAVGDVVPLREERCDTKHEGPFRLTSGGNGSSSVHYCTLQQGHGGKHYDGVSGKDWRG